MEEGDLFGALIRRKINKDSILYQSTDLLTLSLPLLTLFDKHNDNHNGTYNNENSYRINTNNDEDHKNADDDRNNNNDINNDDDIPIEIFNPSHHRRNHMKYNHLSARYIKNHQHHDLFDNIDNSNSNSNHIDITNRTNIDTNQHHDIADSDIISTTSTATFTTTNSNYFSLSSKIEFSIALYNISIDPWVSSDITRNINIDNSATKSSSPTPNMKNNNNNTIISESTLINVAILSFQGIESKIINLEHLPLHQDYPHTHRQYAHHEHNQQHGIVLGRSNESVSTFLLKCRGYLIKRKIIHSLCIAYQYYSHDKAQSALAMSLIILLHLIDTFYLTATAAARRRTTTSISITRSRFKEEAT